MIVDGMYRKRTLKRTPIKRKNVMNKAAVFSNRMANINKRDAYDVINTPRFSNYFDDAYTSKKGFVIGNLGKKKAMFIAGSRKGTDWWGNFKHTAPFSSIPNYVSRKHAAKLSAIARKEKVDYVFGHSRGAYKASHMRGPFRTYGIDGAKVLNPRSKMPNFYLGGKYGFFDPLLNPGRGKTTKYKAKPAWVPHYLYRNKSTFSKRRRAAPRWGRNNKNYY